MGGGWQGWLIVRGSLFAILAEGGGEAGVSPSVGSKRDGYGNALAETTHGLCKVAWIYRRAS